MKKVLFSLVTVVLVLTSCGGMSPTAFNDAIVKATASTGETFTTYDSNLTSSINSDKYEEITALSDSALNKIEAELKIVKELEAPKDAQSYKEVAVKYFQSIKDMVEVGKGFAKLTKDSSEEEYNKIYKEYSNKNEEYSKIYDELAAAQAAYAKEVGYKVEN